MGDIVQRVEKHKILKTDEIYSFLDTCCFNSKNLYNHANYLLRQEYIKNHKFIGYNNLDKMLKNDKVHPDYTSLPLIQSSQQLLRLLCKNWKSYFEAIKDYKLHPEKYNGRPKLPKYSKKIKGRKPLILTNQNCKLDGNKIVFPKAFNGFEIETEINKKSNFKCLSQVRILPMKNYFIVEIVYKVENKDLVTNSNLICIDLGINNLATVTNNIGKRPFIINGKGLSSINQYYNKNLATLKSIAETRHKRKSTNRISSLTNKRNQRVENFMHKASRYIVNYCKDNNISKIIIGYNKGWKNEVNMSKKTNQKFVEIPYRNLIDKIQYKANEIGIEVIEVEESYTSGTSFLDFEKPTKDNYNKSRRVKRGLFKSNEGHLINADVNGSYQITKKYLAMIYKNRESIKNLKWIPYVVNII